MGGHLAVLRVGALAAVGRDLLTAVRRHLADGHAGVVARLEELYNHELGLAALLCLRGANAAGRRVRGTGWGSLAGLPV